MKIRKFFRGFLLAGLGLCPAATMAQGYRTDVTEGKAAKIVILSDFINAGGASFSPDGKYAGGIYAGEGFIYDLEKDSAWISLPARYIVSPDLYAGEGIIFRNGQKIDVEGMPADTNNGGTTLWAATPDLSTLFSMSFEKETFSNGRSMTVNYAYEIDGETGKIVDRIEPHWPFDPDGSQYDFVGFGERVNVTSSDGMILAGHCANPKGLINMSPVLWDRYNDTSFAIVDGADGLYGTIESMNNDGSICFVSFVDEGVYMVRYDREKVSYSLEKLPLAPGRTYGFVGDVSETGLVLFMQQPNMADYGNRESYIYNMENKTLYLLDDYLRELYGLEVPFPLYSSIDISDDGRLIGGYLYSNEGKVPFVIELGEKQIPVRPASCQARQLGDQLAVTVSWMPPMKGQYNLVGYNVYCDSVKINSELIPQGTLSFTQTEGVEPGTHTYAVQAVYEYGVVSGYSEPFSLMVVAETGCYPVRNISNHVTYNRFVDIFWGLPSPYLTGDFNKEPSKEAVGTEPEQSATVNVGKKVSSSAKSYENGYMDLIGYTPLVGYTWSSAFVKDGKLYMADYASNVISVFDYLTLESVGQYAVDGISKITNMSFYGDNLYVASDSKEIRILDMETMTVSNRFVADSAVRNICYVPTLDGGKGGFVYGSWLDLHYADRFFQPIEVEHPVDISDLGISGLAYYDGALYMFSQSGDANAEIYKADLESGEIVAKKDFSQEYRLTSIAPGYSFYAGGLCSSILPDSTVVLLSMLQFSSSNSHLAYLELESAPNLEGYNLYRNGEKVNPDGEYIKRLTYHDEIHEAGTYAYQVETVTKSGCTSKLDEVKTEVTIVEVGECPAPKNLSAYESGHSVVVGWEYDSDPTDPGLVGYDIYRNGELISDKYATERFIDAGVELGDYVYRIETYHENSCIGADSVEVTVDNQGEKMTPVGLTLSAAAVGSSGNFDITASWNLPYFEEPLPMGYSNIPFNGVAAEGAVPVCAVIGWDSSVLANYADYYVVGMEFFIGEDITGVDALVYLNDTLRYRIPFTDRIRELEWNTILFNEPVPMNQRKELVLGYEVSYSNVETPVAIYDYGPASDGYGNLLSIDGGKSWMTLAATGVDANWCINALVVRQRDLGASKGNSYAAADEPVVMRMVDKLGAGLHVVPLSSDLKTASANVNLLGFNIYRDGEKLNGEILKDLSYVDKDVARGAYDYSVAAVYGEDDEMECQPVYIDLSEVSNGSATAVVELDVYPNPASAWVEIKGAYRTLDIYDLSGSRVARYEAQGRIPVSDLASGIYMLNFTLEDGTCVSRKMVVR